MSVVSWGAPTLQFYPLSSTTPPPTTTWHPSTGLLEGVIEIPGTSLLEGSSQLNTTEGEVKALRNEKGLEVDKKTLPSSYAFSTSIIKTKEYVAPFESHNGMVDGEYAMRLIPEDPTTIGFELKRATISMAKGWDAEQGALDNLTVNGVLPSDPTQEVCADYVESAS